MILRVMDLIKGETGEVALHEFAGDHYEMGLQQGRRFKQQIEHAMSLDFAMGLEAFKLAKPKLIPPGLFLRLGRWRAVRLLRDDLFEYYPRQARRLEGMAEALGWAWAPFSSCCIWSFF